MNEKVYFTEDSKTMPMSPNIFNNNSRVNIIQVGMFEKRENIYESIKEFSDYNIMIKPYKNTHIVYVMDVRMTMIDEMLNRVQTKYSDAFVYKKIHLYKKPQKVETKIVVKIEEPEPIKKIEEVKIVKKFDKPVDLDKLISSFENLPSAIYGRI